MLTFLLPLAAKIIKDAVSKIPENEELGEKMVEICLVILAKAVKLTKTDMDDQLHIKMRKSVLSYIVTNEKSIISDSFYSF